MIAYPPSMQPVATNMITSLHFDRVTAGNPMTTGGVIALARVTDSATSTKIISGYGAGFFATSTSQIPVLKLTKYVAGVEWEMRVNSTPFQTYIIDNTYRLTLQVETTDDCQALVTAKVYNRNGSPPIIETICDVNSPIVSGDKAAFGIIDLQTKLSGIGVCDLGRVGAMKCEEQLYMAPTP